MHIESSDLALEIDEGTGTVASLRATRDPGLELAGTPENTGYPRWRQDAPWLGDLLLRAWHGGSWGTEATWRSGRPAVRREGGAIVVDYAGVPATGGGIASVALRQRWEAAGETIVWSIELANNSERVVELGEVAAAFLFNTDYESIFRGEEDKARRSGGELQRRWHEERLQQHLHVAGSGSYALYQRPSGEGPVLFVGPLGASAWEAAYQIDPDIADQWSNTFEGPYWIATHSRAARLEGRWLRKRQRQNLSMHGNSSLLLAPGERYALAFQLAVMDDPAEVRGRLARNGQAAVEVLPGPAVPVGESVQLLVAGPDAVELLPESGNVVPQPMPRAADGSLRWRIALDTPGEKTLLLRYGDGRWTRVFLYATARPREAFAARGRFILERQRFRNPADPFGRDGALMPYDNDRECIYLQSEEAWQTGGSDEYGVTVGMVLAEKNVHLPEAAEVAALDACIDGFLLGKLQDPQTLDIRRGLYFWPERPSGIGHEWTEAVAAETSRYNNYPLVANVYFAMYRIARAHGLGQRPAAAYLSLCWRTLVRGFEIGITRLAGAPAGAFQFEVLEALRTADAEGYEALGAWLDRYTGHVRTDAYPYGSELYIDQTAHAQVFAAVSRHGTPAEIERTLRITRAMRAGYQPSWFRYGNDERGSVCCWYGTPQNSEVLLQGFERSGDLDLLALGAGGLTSFLTTLLPTGAARGWFTWWPDRTGFEPRSLDTDLGLYSYLRAAKAYVVAHPRAGVVGFGCRVEERDGTLVVTPWDGVHKRLWLCIAGLDIALDHGEIARAEVGPDGGVVLWIGRGGSSREGAVAVARRIGNRPGDGAARELRIEVALADEPVAVRIG